MSKFNQNPHNLAPGDRVIVDKGYQNSCEVVIKSMTPLSIFSIVVSDDGTEWQTMTYRLSPIEQK